MNSSRSGSEVHVPLNAPRARPRDRVVARRGRHGCHRCVNRGKVGLLYGSESKGRHFDSARELPLAWVAYLALLVASMMAGWVGEARASQPGNVASSVALPGDGLRASDRVAVQG